LFWGYRYGTRAPLGPWLKASKLQPVQPDQHRLHRHQLYDSGFFTHFVVFVSVWHQGRGGRKNKAGKRQTSAPARKNKYVATCLFYYCFSAFLGVSRQGEFENENTRFFLSTFHKNSPGKYFFGGGFFFRVDFLTFFPFDFFVALVKRLSVRETQKRDKKTFCEVVRLNFSPLPIFFYCVFGHFSISGAQKRD
jgi:hypothetical protein